MIDKKGIITNIIFTINMIADPIKGFLRYQNGKMYEFYTNFLEFVLTDLFDDCQIESLIIGDLPKWGIKKDTLHLLKDFLKDMEDFSEKHDKSDDYTLLRDNYWDNFVEKAKKCVELFERDLKVSGII
ncbi:MAG: hypothetical protein GY830_08105 [Bacteroidetes bacterium]|nr:hypothetical protein [Bacteroidota bacterium]